MQRVLTTRYGLGIQIIVRNSTFFTQYIYVFCVDLRTKSNYFPIPINVSVFITESESVYSAVRTGDLNKAVYVWARKGFYNRDEKCLQRGTDWGFKSYR
jgi:hypothetical protein